jgi:hypothetical protein
VVFRVAANIPIPGIGAENLKQFFGQNQVFGLLNLFTGGALSNFSLPSSSVWKIMSKNFRSIFSKKLESSHSSLIISMLN